MTYIELIQMGCCEEGVCNFVRKTGIFQAQITPSFLKFVQGRVEKNDLETLLCALGLNGYVPGFGDGGGDGDGYAGGFVSGYGVYGYGYGYGFGNGDGLGFGFVDGGGFGNGGGFGYGNGEI